jgi:hypothetical protein
VRRGSLVSQWLAVAVVLLVACSDDEPAAPIVVPECSDPLTITVTADSVLTFSWTPYCRLMGWLIELAADGGDKWIVWSEGSNSVAPPITYGIVPDGATQVHYAGPLIHGTEYKLLLHRWIGPGPRDRATIASTTFVR